jgi:hypothetical protein
MTIGNLKSIISCNIDSVTDDTMITVNGHPFCIKLESFRDAKDLFTRLIFVVDLAGDQGFDSMMEFNKALASIENSSSLSAAAFNKVPITIDPSIITPNRLDVKTISAEKVYKAKNDMTDDIHLAYTAIRIVG